MISRVIDAFVLIIAYFDKYCFSANFLIGNFSLACRILNKQILSDEWSEYYSAKLVAYNNLVFL